MFKNKKILFLLLSLMLLVSFTACGNKDANKANNKNSKNIEEKQDNKKEESKEETSKYPLTIKDSFDRDVTIEKEPTKVVSLAPSITEIIFALDKVNTLVGRTSFCNYPADVEKVEVIGDLQTPDVEKIVSLEPDLIIASSHFKQEILAKFEEVGLKVAVINEAESFEGTYTTIEKVANVLNAEEKAKTLIDSMKKKVEDVKAKVKDAEKPSVYYAVWFDYTAGKGTFINELLEMAGAVNAADDAEGWSQYSLEKLVDKNPSMIIATDNLFEQFKAKEGYKDLPAIKEGKIYSINQDMISRQGPRIADAFEELAKIIHPELFK